MASKINWTFLDEKLPTEKSPDGDDKWKEQRRAVFTQYFDGNNNGYCSLAECDKGLSELLSSNDGSDDMSTIVTKPVIIRAFNSAKSVAQERCNAGSTNSTNNDYIEFSEFRYFLIYIKEYIKLWELFDIIDSDNDRRISSDEFIQTLPKLKENEYGSILGITTNEPTTAESIFQSIDTNHGGHILFIELAQYLIQKKMMIE